MYLRTRDELAQVPTSYLYDYSMHGLGNGPPKPVLLTHFHVRKYLDPRAGLLSDPAASVMTVAQMKPGFVAATDSRRVRLQTNLTKLVQDKYPTAVSPKVQLRIALVDLTDVKHHTPIFAGFEAFNAYKPEGGATMEGASLTKILPLYALYQLRFDLNTFAARQGILTGRALRAAIAKEWKKAGLRSEPNLSKLFRFVESAGKPVEAKLLRTPVIDKNLKARELIVALGFEYIGSVALQSGLFDETQGGLWLNGAYATPRITWGRSPFPKLPRHSATALSAATFFTLLAQGRLVNQASSNEIAKVLNRQCMSPGLLDGVRLLSGTPAESPNRCGILRPLYHEAIHMIRQPAAGKRLEYVAAVLSAEPPVLDFTELGKDLDGIIAQQNP